MMLRSTIALLLFASPIAAYASDVSLRGLFNTTADMEGVPSHLLRAVCWVESGHRNVTRVLDGRSPSFGICQIKLATARMLGYKGEVRELRNVAVNILWAARYLKFQLDRYKQDWRKAVTAYNRGTFRGRLINRYVLKVQVAMLEGR